MWRWDWWETTQMAITREWQTNSWKSTSKIIGEFREESDGEMTREEVANLLKHWEQPRHLMFWSNHSSIINQGHVLLTVTGIYDPAFYYTPEKLGGGNVQDLMEKPQIYLLARCRDTLRISCFTEDIQQVTTKIDSSHNVPITGICLLFRGDHPAQEVESGEQIGGNVSSCGCTASSTQYPDHIVPQ